jgi:hypothetical protein
VPLQSRVTPFGDLVAHPSKAATLTGNRGIIHDPATRTLGTSRWTTKAWIACTCSYKGINRSPIWTQRQWTELFFLDEATALAAGHRPCFTCRRADAVAFREAWSLAHHLPAPSAPEMDTALHAERLSGKHKRLHPVPSPLPDGTMLAAGPDAFLIANGHTWRWTFDGYEQVPHVKFDALLTPPSIVAALAAGYRPALHPSVLTA